MKKIGIALGGGGSRGFAHIGVLKALEEEGIKVSMISGTSAGAIIGAFYGDGKTPDEILELMKDLNLYDLAKFRLPRKGFASLKKLEGLLEEELEAKDFKDLKIPLYAAVSNLSSGEVEYLNEGDVSLAVQASSSIPILFSPVEINGDACVDGGVLDNVPVRPLKDQCDKIIAVNITPVREAATIDNMRDLAARVFEMSISMQDHKEDCELIISLKELTDIPILDTSRNEQIYEMAYKHAKSLDFSEFK